MKSTLLKLGVVSLFLSLIGGAFVGKAQAEPYGWSPNVDNSWGGTPSCTDAKPDKAPILLQPNHPKLPQPTGKGQVRLQWHKVPGATGYNVYYGLSRKNYIYSVTNLPDTDNYTVSHLANKVYYFAVQAKKGCAAGALSNEWAARPGKGGFLVAAPGFTPIVKKASTAVKKTTTTTYLPSPTAEAQVKGIASEPTQEVVYQPETPVETYQPPQIPTPTPTPKLSLWQRILDTIFGKRK